MAQARWKRYWRIRRQETILETPPNITIDWNVATDAFGWHDMPPIDSDSGLNPQAPNIFPQGQGARRALNMASPVPGAYLPELGSLEMPVYPEMIDPILVNMLGQVARVETAGSAALASTAFASVATLDTQPDGTEQLKFTIASSTQASSAVINIIQSATTVESINIGTSASSVDGDYYSKNGYDGSTNAITFTVSGTVTAGTVVVAGVDYVTNTYTMVDSATVPLLMIEQGGFPEAGSGNSEYFPDVIVQQMSLAYDRNANDGLLTATPTFHGNFPTAATAGTYDEEATKYYKPIAGWNGTTTIDAAGSAEIVSMTLNANSNNQLLAASSGTKGHSEAITGQFEVQGSMVVRPTDETHWDRYTGATNMTVVADFITPHYVVDTTGYQVQITITQAVIENYTRGADDQAHSATLDFRGVYNDTDAGPFQIVTRGRMPL